jgi:hypothetical protein
MRASKGPWIMRSVLFTALALASAPTSAGASQIIQVLNLRYTQHNSNEVPYNQFNPALDPLNVVTIQTANGVVGSGTARAFNSSSVTVNYNLIMTGQVGTDTGIRFLNSSTPETIGPITVADVDAQASFAPGIVIESRYAGSDLSPFIGTGTIRPFLDVNFSLSTDNPAVTVSSQGTMNPNSGVVFTETITYDYGAPEPASVVMFGIGLSVVAVIAWRSHRSSHRLAVKPSA